MELKEFLCILAELDHSWGLPDFGFDPFVNSFLCLAIRPCLSHIPQRDINAFSLKNP